MASETLVPASVAISALGCKVNQEEAESLRALMQEAGYQVVGFEEPADIYIIHTCTVTHIADRKSRQLIRRARRQNPKAVIVASGCYPQAAPQEVAALPEVDVILGVGQRLRLPELIEEARSRRRQAGGEETRPGWAIGRVLPPARLKEFEELPPAHPVHVRAYLKVQEGCQHFCSYCIVPQARGPWRSRAPGQVAKEARRLIAAGYQELILTGTCLGAYGRDLGTEVNLARLIRQLASLPGLKRLQLSSIEPWEFGPDLVEVVGENLTVCPHLHIPLQSGDADILKRMRRHHGPTYFRQLLESLRSRRPGLAITTDILVGFPGETEDQHQNSLAFTRAMGFSRLHVFKYSPRRGTAAARLPDQVRPQVKERRSREFLELSQQLFRQYASSFLGTSLEVLVERPVSGQPGWWEGHTPNYLLVYFRAPGPWQGRLAMVTITKVRSDYVLEGGLAGGW